MALVYRIKDVRLAEKDGRKAKKRDKLRYACAHFRTAIEGVISIAVHEYATPSDAMPFFQKNKAANLLDQYLESSRLYLEKVRSMEMPADYRPLMDLRHCLLACLIGEWDLAERLRQLGNDWWRPCVEYIPSRKNVFSETLLNNFNALFEGTPGPPIPEMRLVKEERYIIAHIQLIHSLSTGRGVDEAIQYARERFAQRQKDKRLDEPNFIDGSFHDPVRWDFTTEAILVYAEHKELIGSS